METALNPQIDFNIINQDGGLLNILTTYKDSQLVVLMLENNIDFIGKISHSTKQLIQETLTLNDYYEMDFDIYKMVLDDYIYIFKKFGEDKKVVLVGILINNSNKNRLEIIDKQTNYLLKKSEKW